MAEWMYKLGALHQYKGVPYVEHANDGDVICQLCGTGWMGPHQRKKHFHGSKHAARYQSVRRLEEEDKQRRQKIEEEAARRRRKLEAFEAREVRARAYEVRIMRLGLKRWRDCVHSSLYRYVLDDQLGDTEKVLEHLEKKERLSLLELAVWKARAIDGVVFRTTDEIREQQALDREFDASAYLRTQRVLSGCHVIVSRVAKFL